LWEISAGWEKEIQSKSRETPAEMHRQKLAQYLTEARTNTGLTQKQVGEVLGVDASQVSRWERGDQLPGPQRLVPLADVLRVDADELRALFMDAQQEELVSARQERDLMMGAMRSFVAKYSEFHAAYEEIVERVRRLDERDEHLESRIVAAVLEALNKQAKQKR
jgi:transcriptional regulator with XRE-family HTH domain